MTDTAEPPKVFAAISSVTQILSRHGIEKNKTTTGYASFNFRGIDDVMNALALALVESKLVIIPRMIDRVETIKKSAKGNDLFYIVITAEFDFVSAEDGSIYTSRAYGEAMDSGDKATNKAMSMAYKYATLQAFCVPTVALDPDWEQHDLDSGLPKKEAISAEWSAWINKGLAARKIDRIDFLNRHGAADVENITTDRIDSIKDELTSKRTEQ